MVEHDEFREDLYYRLRVATLRTPPLRERPQDIPLLRHFLEQAANRFGVLLPEVPDGELQRLLASPWPVNVRELQNAAEEALAGRGALCFRLREAQNGGPLPVAMRPPAVRPSSETPPSAPPASPFPRRADARYLAQALEACGGKIRGPGGAVELLGLNYNTLRDKLEKYGVPYGRGVQTPTE